MKLARGELLVSLPGEPDSERVKALLHRWYLDRARDVFGDVLDASLLRFKGIERPRLIVRTMQSRWGSLSPAGTMTLNVNLVRASRSCIEHVVTHELCHTRHRGYDARFFKLLWGVMPDWEKAQRAAGSGVAVKRHQWNAWAHKSERSVTTDGLSGASSRAKMGISSAAQCGCSVTLAGFGAKGVQKRR